METSSETGTRTVVVQVVIGGCCGPTTSPFDDRVEAVVRQAVTESGVQADLRRLSISEAYYGAVPPAVVERLAAESRQSGASPLPVVLMNGAIVTSGVLPDIEELRTALRRAATTATTVPKGAAREE